MRLHGLASLAAIETYLVFRFGDASRDAEFSAARYVLAGRRSNLLDMEVPRFTTRSSFISRRRSGDAESSRKPVRRTTWFTTACWISAFTVTRAFLA
jgi:hypothetical protein